MNTPDAVRRSYRYHTAWLSARQGRLVNLECPACSFAGPHPTNGDKHDWPLACCEKCGEHFEVQPPSHDDSLDVWHCYCPECHTYRAEASAP